LRLNVFDVSQASYLLGYASPASLYILLIADLLKDYVEMFEEQALLKMGSKIKFPTLAKRVRALVNFQGRNEIFMLDPKEEESLQKIRDNYHKKRGPQRPLSVSNNLF
tara:strand:- start:43 stop:366 length:324 start_codon:yes stop_codon:yes gene_type:complete